MMQSARVWAFSLCAAVVLSALMRMLAPKSQKASLSLVVNLFLLLCLLEPLSKVRIIPIPDFLANKSAVTETAQAQADELYTKQIKRRIAAAADEKLRTLGIIAQEVRIDISVSENGFSIDGVWVRLDETDSPRAALAAQALQDYLGLPVAVGTKEVT